MKKIKAILSIIIGLISIFVIGYFVYVGVNL